MSRDRIMGESTASNIGGSLTRVNSVTSVLKRLFSKEDRPDGNNDKGDNRPPSRLPSSNSAASLQAKYGGWFILCQKLFISCNIYF